jgi:hypothetical protein
MKVSRIRKGVVFVVVAGALGLGCELIVDFDRTKIPVESADTGTGTDSSVDANFDAMQPDTSTVDAADAADTSVPTDAADAADAPDGD